MGKLLRGAIMLQASAPPMAQPVEM